MASIIGVETLQHTNGTTAATIDSSGRILQPAKPAFEVSLSADLTSQNLDSAAKLTFNTKEFDTGSDYSTSTGQFTAPVDGVYHFDTTVRMDSVSAAYAYAGFIINDGSAQNGHINLTDNEGNSYHTFTIGITVKLSANDTVHVAIRASGDTSCTVIGGSRFSGFLVG